MGHSPQMKRTQTLTWKHLSFPSIAEQCKYCKHGVDGEVGDGNEKASVSMLTCLTNQLSESSGFSNVFGESK